MQTVAASHRNTVHYVALRGGTAKLRQVFVAYRVAPVDW